MPATLGHAEHTCIAAGGPNLSVVGGLRHRDQPRRCARMASVESARRTKHIIEHLAPLAQVFASDSIVVH
jgi:hypothetical protein